MSLKDKMYLDHAGFYVCLSHFWMMFMPVHTSYYNGMSINKQLFVGFRYIFKPYLTRFTVKNTARLIFEDDN
jgi:hypothetical protein